MPPRWRQGGGSSRQEVNCGSVWADRARPVGGGPVESEIHHRSLGPDALTISFSSTTEIGIIIDYLQNSMFAWHCRS